jgi:hypothetical protein
MASIVQKWGAGAQTLGSYCSYSTNELELIIFYNILESAEIFDEQVMIGRRPRTRTLTAESKPGRQTAGLVYLPGCFQSGKRNLRGYRTPFQSLANIYDLKCNVAGFPSWRRRASDDTFQLSAARRNRWVNV